MKILYIFNLSSIQKKKLKEPSLILTFLLEIDFDKVQNRKKKKKKISRLCHPQHSGFRFPPISIPFFAM